MQFRRNGKIELLRFVFAMIIVMHHSRFFLGDENCLFLGGSFGVEFFFIVSGYLMMASIEKIQSKIPVPVAIGKETRLFLWKKIKAVYPEVIVAWMIAFAFVSKVTEKGIRDLITHFCESVWEIIFLYMTGVGTHSVNGVIWYISAMLLCMSVLYPLIRKYPDVMINIVVPITMLLAYGWLFQNFSNPRSPSEWIGFTFKGNIRAYGDLCMGIIGYIVAKKIRGISWSSFGHILLNIIEWGIYAVVIVFMYVGTATDSDYFFILLLTIAIILSFSQQGVDDFLFNNSICMFLGKFSLPLYLTHTFYARYWNQVCPADSSNGEKMILYLLCSFITAIIVMGISQFIQKNQKKIGRISNLLVDKK